MSKQFIKVGIIVLAIILGIFYIVSKQDTQMSYQLLPVTEFQSKLSETPNAVLLDVRTPEEFNSGHLEGAVNIDFENSTFASEIQKLDKEKSYFIYCRSGSRSAGAVSLMKKEGIKNIFELKGGLISVSQN